MVPDLPSYGRTAHLFDPESFGLIQNIQTVYPDLMDDLKIHLIDKMTPTMSRKSFLIGISLGRSG